MLTRRGHVRRGQLLSGRGGREGALQVHRLVEQFVTDEDDQGKEAELEVAAMFEKNGNVISNTISLLLSFKGAVCRIDT